MTIRRRHNVETPMIAEQIGISLAQQVKCAERELTMRQVVYPGRVRQKKMTAAQAQFEIAAMRSIVATLKALEKSRD